MNNNKTKHNSKSGIDFKQTQISDGCYSRESFGDWNGKEIKKAFTVGKSKPGPSSGVKKK